MLQEGNVRKRSIAKKLGMYATHQKKLNNDRMFSCRLASGENYAEDLVIRIFFSNLAIDFYARCLAMAFHMSQTLTLLKNFSYQFLGKNF